MTKDEAWEMIDSSLDHSYSEKDVTAIKEALALTSTPCEVQPEQEPVARFDANDLIESLGTVTFLAHQGQQLKNGDMLYTNPPKREWVGMGWEDIQQARQKCGSMVEAMQYINNWLKEKNA